MKVEAIKNLSISLNCPLIDSSKSTFTQKTFLAEVLCCSGKLTESKILCIYIFFFSMFIVLCVFKEIINKKLCNYRVRVNIALSSIINSWGNFLMTNCTHGDASKAICIVTYICNYIKLQRPRDWVQLH